MDLEKLKGKIASKEEFAEILRDNPEWRGNLRNPSGLFGNYPTWWVNREYLRASTGIYQSTEILDKINTSYNHLCVHVSVQDSTMVAYTVDAASGESDRQLKISLGRLLYKLYPYLPDEVVQDAVSAHQAELSTEVEFISGPAIAEAYQEGPASCMKKDVPWTVSPLLAYDAPNIRLAVLRNKEGVINARCLVYEPSPNDKRLIRAAYGDSLLGKRLLRLGYVPGTFHGAVFNTIKVGEGRYAMPYLDGMNRQGGPAVSSVALIDGKIHSISEEQARRIRSLQYTSTSTACNTNGYTTLSNLESAKFLKTDCITGLPINTLLVDPLQVMLEDQSLGLTISDISEWNQIKYVLNGRMEGVTAHPNITTFTHRYYQHLDNEETRRAAGFYKLDPQFYESSEWISQSSGYGISSTLSIQANGFALKTEDTVTVVSKSGEKVVDKRVHKSLFSKDWVKVHSIRRNVPLYAEDKSIVVKTNTGRKVVPGLHDVVKLITTGEWAFSRSATSFWFAGIYLYELKSTALTVEYYTNILRTIGQNTSTVDLISEIGSYISQVIFAGQYIRVYNMRRDTPPMPVLDFMLHIKRTETRPDVKALASFWLERYYEATAIEYPSPAPCVVEVPTPIVELVGEPA